MKSVTPRLQLVEPDAPQGSERPPPAPHLPPLKKPREHRGEIMDTHARWVFEMYGALLEKPDAGSE